MPPEEDQAIAKVNKQRKLGDIQTCSSSKYGCKQTDTLTKRQAHHNTSHLYRGPGGVIIQSQLTTIVCLQCAWRSAMGRKTVVRAGSQGALDEQVEWVDDQQSAHQNTQSHADTIRQTSECWRACHAFYDITTQQHNSFYDGSGLSQQQHQ